MILCWLLALVFTPIFSQKDPHFVENHSAIVHLFEWKWPDIARECEDFLSIHGFGGIQISPPNENVIVFKRPWWERYQPVSYLLETRSGTEEDFKEMTRRCNKVGVRIYADIVINHMSGGDGIGIAGNTGRASKYYFPGVPYGPEHFHKHCTINHFDDVNELRTCELVGLKDLDQSLEYVRNKIVEFLNHLINLGVAGFRVDAARHMDPDDLEVIYNRLNDLNTSYGFPQGSRAFIFQEVSDGNASTREEYTPIGTVMEFRYGNLLSKVFSKRDKLKHLESWGPDWGLLDPGTDAVTFIDNHDNQRSDRYILTYKKEKPYKMAVAFMLAHPYGIPRVMSSFDFAEFDAAPPQDKDGNLLSPEFDDDGTCFGEFVCEHRWPSIFNMVGFRNAVDGTEVENWQTIADNQIAFCRGNKGFIAFNNEGDLKKKLNVCLPKGRYCDVISGNLEGGKCTGKEIMVDENGYASISIDEDDDDGVLAIHEKSKI